jgi:hypothetical protein
MRFYQTERDIAAPAETVWRILTDAGRLGQGFGLLKIEGQIVAGERIKVWSEASPGRAFPLRVTAMDRPSRMIWQGGMPLGLFTGTRVFSLDPLPSSGCRFRMREDYTGPLARMIFRSIPDLQPSFETFGDALKRESEQ